MLMDATKIFICCWSEIVWKATFLLSSSDATILGVIFPTRSNYSQNDLLALPIMDQDGP